MKRPHARTFGLLTALAVAALSCGESGSDTEATTTAAEPVVSDSAASSEPSGPSADFTLRIGAIPDQDPEKLARQFGAVSEYLSAKTGAKVEYVPVTDYAAAVTGFKVGDLDLVWFGGLTGVQAQSLVPDAVYVAQRDVDATFQSVFIAGTSAGISPIADVAGLSVLKGTSLTFGSESSTSGRLMPQYFLGQAGLTPTDFAGGQPGFSGSHDQTIRLVETGSYQTGALNKKVWDKAVAEGTVDTAKVQVVFTTPEYFDYHWLAQPDLDSRAGNGFTASIRDALLALDKTVPADADLLTLFGGGAGAFIPTETGNYDKIRAIATDLELLTTGS